MAACSSFWSQGRSLNIEGLVWLSGNASQGCEHGRGHPPFRIPRSLAVTQAAPTRVRARLRPVRVGPRPWCWGQLPPWMAQVADSGEEVHPSRTGAGREGRR
ncbi:hypothetical protein N9L68_02775 [bacterium]|nr:hypothetical protein [bacterium]